MSARVCVVTAGHLATCPRMLKAADALADAGYRVRMVSARHVAWAARADEDARRARAGKWAWTAVDYTADGGRWLRARSGMRRRALGALARGLGAARLPLPLAAGAFARVHRELVRAIVAEPADLYYAGTTGALAAAAEAGRRTGTPYALDLEDFHSAEQDDSRAARLAHALARRIEARILPGAAFLTASSAAIAEAYARAYGVRPIPVHNAFPLPARPPDCAPTPGAGLRLYWFSQTIGPRRGLEDAVRAMGLAGLPGELHLRGRPAGRYLEALARLAAEVAPRLRIVSHEPAPPDAMVDLCRGHDVGLCLEQGHVLNKSLCLGNKALTYILAGLAVALTDTPGQRPLAGDLGPGALPCGPGDVGALARGLARWAGDREALGRARAAAWDAARRRWHWEHPDERGRLLEAVARGAA